MCLNLVLVRIWGEKNNNDKSRILVYLSTLCLTLIVKELKISVEQGRMVTISDIFYEDLKSSWIFEKINEKNLKFFTMSVHHIVEILV